MSIDWLLAAGLVLWLDQRSKAWALARPGSAAGRGPGVGRGPRIRPVRNARHGLGLGPRALACLWLAATAGSVVALHRLPALSGGVAHLGLGAALGGATGNLLDRLRHAAVIDFVDLRCWPVFNLADVAIVAGTAIALGSAW